jgi:hypothetical protein
MLTQISIELTQWMKHHKQTIARLTMLNKKAITCYFGPVIKICLRRWFPLSKEDTPIDFPKPQLVQER